MADKLPKDLENMSVEELLEIEEKIMKILKVKIKYEKNNDWRKDFLDISVWSHLDKESNVKVDKWKIETF